MADLSELDLVMLSLDDDVLSHIATETNRNYHAKFETEPAKHKSAWTDLTVDELKSFIGIIIAISLTQIRGRVKKSGATNTVSRPFLGLVKCSHVTDSCR